jgi:hypothetical protein
MPDAFRLASGHVRGSGVMIVRRTMRESSLWQEVTAIPLQAYFLTIGALLTALLLLFNLMLDPSKSESPQPLPTSARARAPRGRQRGPPKSPAALPTSRPPRGPDLNCQRHRR